MRRCIELAQRADGLVRRPCVGAVVLSKDGRVVGEGYKHLVEHTKLVMHAERAALNCADGSVRDGTLITTLEPCVRKKYRNLYFLHAVNLLLTQG